MGKNKKKVTLTHAEVWDDSALVQSWDDAVEEYQVRHQMSNSRDQYLTWPQHYWSIHAKGENVEDVLRATEDTGVVPAIHDSDIQSTKPVEDGANKTQNEDVSIVDEQISEPVPEVYCHFNVVFFYKGLADNI